MGTLTTQQIIQQGLDYAGNPGIDNQALVAFNAWLRRKYTEGMYHVPKRIAVNTTLGAASVDVSDIGHDIVRVENIYVLDGSPPPKYELHIIPHMNNEVGHQQGQSSTTSFGTPLYGSVQYGEVAGGVRVFMFPRPDKAYTIETHCYVIPTALALNDVPDYPNDETMIHAVYVWALGHMKQLDEMRLARAELGRMEALDRALYLARKGQEETMELDSRYFQRGPVHGPQFGAFKNWYTFGR